RQAGEGEISDFHRRNQTSTYTLRFAHRFDIVKHDDRALVESEVFQWKLDLAVFDVEGTVTGKACVQQGVWIYCTDIPESGYQHRSLGALDHVSGGLITSGKDKSSSSDASSWSGQWWYALLLCPIARVGKVFHNPIFYPNSLLSRHSITIPRSSRDLSIGWVR